MRSIGAVVATANGIRNHERHEVHESFLRPTPRKLRPKELETTKVSFAPLGGEGGRRSDEGEGGEMSEPVVRNVIVDGRLVTSVGGNGCLFAKHRGSSGQRD